MARITECCVVFVCMYLCPNMCSAVPFGAGDEDNLIDTIEASNSTTLATPDDNSLDGEAKVVLYIIGLILSMACLLLVVGCLVWVFCRTRQSGSSIRSQSSSGQYPVTCQVTQPTAMTAVNPQVHEDTKPLENAPSRDGSRVLGGKNFTVGVGLEKSMNRMTHGRPQV